MARSKCPSCGGYRFEVQEASPLRAAYKVMFIQCTSCGTVVGTTDYYNIPALLGQIAKKLGVRLF